MIYIYIYVCVNNDIGSHRLTGDQMVADGESTTNITLSTNTTNHVICRNCYCDAGILTALGVIIALLTIVIVYLVIYIKKHTTKSIDLQAIAAELWQDESIPSEDDGLKIETLF